MGDVSYDLRHAEEGLHRRLLKIHNWQNFVLPRLYEYEEKISKDLQPVLKEESTFRRWLIETLGPPSII
jgi:hypothetical protein